MSDHWSDTGSRTEADAERAARAHDDSPDRPGWFQARRWDDEIPDEVDA